MRILAVEDHQITQKVIKMILEEAGCSNINIASTGMEALEFLKNNEYELVLIDIGLPDINGLTIAEHIKNSKSRNINSTIIILSAYSDILYKESAEMLGIDYIIKPFTQEKCATLFKKYFPHFKIYNKPKEFDKLKTINNEIDKYTDTLHELQTIHSLKCIRINDLDICYNNEKVAKEIYEEIFVKKIYDFETSKEKPIIIDAGSNIGIAMLYFKMRYPLASILCFEPDPNTFEILKKNVIINNLNDVRLINAALSNKIDMISFFGEVHGMETDTRGNSIIKEWGIQRETSSEILVNSTRLSSYIESEIDLLKLDIEGAEQEVLEELGEKLNFIRQIVVEVHEMNSANINNSLHNICQLLEKHNFKINIEPLHGVEFLPKQTSKWVKAVCPSFTIVRGQRI